MTGFLVFWAMVAVIGTIIGSLAYFHAYDDDYARSAARTIVASLLAPLVLPALLVYGVYRLARELPRIVRATEWGRWS